jgi:GGDEF domain-containing protein
MPPAGRLRDRIGVEGSVGRWGGEEFIAVLPDAEPDIAAGAAEALRDASAAHSVELGGDPAVL